MDVKMIKKKYTKNMGKIKYPFFDKVRGEYYGI